MKLGINGGYVNYYASQLAFKDLRKQSTFYWTATEVPYGGTPPSVFNTGDTFIPNDFKTDASGNPTNYTSSGNGLAMPAYTIARALMVYEIKAGEPFLYPSGIYHVFYEGKGTIRLANDPGTIDHTVTGGPGSFSALITSPSRLGIRLDISSVDASAEPDYLRNISVVHDDDLDYKTNPFNQKMLDSLQELSDSDGGYFRAMDWHSTNFDGGLVSYNTWSEPATPIQLYWRVANSSWDDRVKPFHPHGEIGGSLEYSVKICNTINRNLWYCVPHTATTDFITSAATYIKDNLNTNLSTVVEWGNEFWNTIFYSRAYCWSGAADPSVSGQYYAGLGSVGDGWSSADIRALQRFGADKTKEAHKIFYEVFDTNASSRIHRTLGAHSANTWYTERMLQWSGVDSTGGVSAALDSFATAPYFGNLGAGATASGILGLGGVGPSSTEEILAATDYEVTGTNGRVRQDVSDAMALANKCNIDLYLYECGQHLLGVGGYTDNSVTPPVFINFNEALLPQFSACNVDPQMGVLYNNYMNMLQDAGVSVACMYVAVLANSRYGLFGLQEYYNQDIRPKYDAILAWLYTQPAIFLNNVKYRLNINS